MIKIDSRRSSNNYKLYTYSAKIHRGTFNHYHFNYSKEKIFKKLFHVYSRFFKKNKIFYKSKLINSILKRFNIDNNYIENLIKNMNVILSETIKNENLNPDVNKSNIKLIPMVLVNRRDLGVSLVVELCLSYYKITFRNYNSSSDTNINDEKTTKVFKYLKIEAEQSSSVDPKDQEKLVIEHLGTCILNFLKQFNIKTVKILPIILIASYDELNIKRSNSIVEDNCDDDSQTLPLSMVYEILNEENTTDLLQEFFDKLADSSKEEKHNEGFIETVFYDHETTESKTEESKSNSIEQQPTKLLVCATIELTMASFLANYFFDEKCHLLVNLNTDLKISFYDSSIEKLVCITFNKLFESSVRRMSENSEQNVHTLNSIPNVYSILTAYDFELDNLNDGKQKYFNNLIGVLNQCELVRLILVDMMMFGVLFEKDYKMNLKNVKLSVTEVADSEVNRMKPVITEKIIKQHNPNIKLYIKYCLHARLYSDIENDTSYDLNKVKKVLKDLGLKETTYFDRIVTKTICKSITKRSAQILAGLITTVFRYLTLTNVNSCIGLDGMIFKSRPKFAAYLDYYLNFYMKNELKYYLKISRVDYSLGAAYGLVFMLDKKIKEGMLKSYYETINNLACERTFINQVNLPKLFFSKFFRFFKLQK